MVFNEFQLFSLKKLQVLKQQGKSVINSSGMRGIARNLAWGVQLDNFGFKALLILNRSICL